MKPLYLAKVTFDWHISIVGPFQIDNKGVVISVLHFSKSGTSSGDEGNITNRERVARRAGGHDGPATAISTKESISFITPRAASYLQTKKLAIVN